MKVLVTGATGVVGRRLVPLLRRASHEVTAVARSPIVRAQLQRHGAAAVELDLFDPAAVRSAVAGHDTVVNLATHVPHSSTRMFLPGAWRENDRIRGIASGVIVDACVGAGVPRFIQESFAPVYPDCGDHWIDETVPIKTVRYNRTIVDAEAAADRFHRSGGTGIVLRFGAFYGPDSSQMLELIPWIKKGWAPVPGSPQAYISSVSHDDAATAVAAALDMTSGVYNVVDDEPVTHEVFVGSLADAIGIAHPKLPRPWMTRLFGSPGELLARSERISNKKLRTSSGWTPRYPSVREGWRSVVEGLKERPGHPNPVALDKTHN